MTKKSRQSLNMLRTKLLKWNKKHYSSFFKVFKLKKLSQTWDGAFRIVNRITGFIANTFIRTGTIFLKILCKANCKELLVSVARVGKVFHIRTADIFYGISTFPCACVNCERIFYDGRMFYRDYLYCFQVNNHQEFGLETRTLTV